MEKKKVWDIQWENVSGCVWMMVFSGFALMLESKLAILMGGLAYGFVAAFILFQKHLPIGPGKRFERLVREYRETHGID